MLVTPLPGLERPEEGVLVAAPAIAGPGAWAGAPSAVLVDDTYFLAYRLRMPLGRGRGLSNVIARSRDGIAFERVAEIRKEWFGAESLERPALVCTDDGRWLLYVSCATPGTKHWRIDAVEAASVEDLGHSNRCAIRTVASGTDEWAIKDPVVVRSGDTWHMWASVHPLDDPDATDRMRTDYATSPDGLQWSWHGPALEPREGEWDARGVRLTAVVLGENGLPRGAYYDGRATAEENWEERTGLAYPSPDNPWAFSAVGSYPAGQSPYGSHGLRYVSIVPLAGGAQRLYFEMTRADGAHELRTTLHTRSFG